MAQPLHYFLFIFPLLILLLLLPHYSLQQHQGPKISAVDLATLAIIRNSLTEIPISKTSFFATWDFSSPDPCTSFAGVVCSSLPDSSSGPRVTSLTLGTGLSGSPGLAGTLSPSISNLTALTQLILSPGIVTGPLPTHLSNLGKLRVLSLARNRFTGHIPSSISFLHNLHTLDLSYNQLTGIVPPGLALGLKVLILASNHLSGELPADLAHALDLLHLDLRKNRISGMLPARLPLTIRYLSLSENLMWGPINGLETLSNLEYLDLSMNQFNGTIPSALFYNHIASLLLQRNNLSGGIPAGVPPQAASLPQIEGNDNNGDVDGGDDDSSSWSSGYGEGSVVDLSHNFLSGELTSVLAGAESLFLNDNRFAGTVPEEYIDSLFNGKTKILYLQQNYLTGFARKLGPTALPTAVSLCASYNCMAPPVDLMSCPLSAGLQLSRPSGQCFPSSKSAYP